MHARWLVASGVVFELAGCLGKWVSRTGTGEAFLAFRAVLHIRSLILFAEFARRLARETHEGVVPFGLPEHLTTVWSYLPAGTVGLALVEWGAACSGSRSQRDC